MKLTRIIINTLYLAIIAIGLLWFFVTQLPLLLTSGMWPALFGITVTVLIVAVSAQLLWARFKKDESTTNKENAP